MNRLKADLVGAHILTEWLGDGGFPVDQDQAEARAKVCETCDQNWDGDWWSRVEATVAVAVMEERRAALALGLKLPNEDKLGSCKVCYCWLATKCFVPFRHIANHTSDEVWAKLPTHCWMHAERKNDRTPR